MTIIFDIFPVFGGRASNGKMCELAAAVAADGRTLCDPSMEDKYKMCVVHDIPPQLHW